MRTFAQKQNPSQQPGFPMRSRAIEPEPADTAINSEVTARSPFAHDFSRVPVKTPAAEILQAGRLTTPVVQRQPQPAAEQESEIDFRYYASHKALSDIRQKIDACKQTKLSQTKITPQSQIDAQTAQTLDDVMERAALCGSLSQYIKLRPQKLSQGHFAIHQHQRSDDFLTTPDTQDASGNRFDANDYHRAVKKYLQSTGALPSSLGDQRSEIQKIGGFYDRRNDRINLPSDGTFGSAVHESVHRLSGLLFDGLYGHDLNEGVTQYFADMILHDEGLPSHSGHAYQQKLAEAQLLIQRLGGWELVAQVYFQQSQDAHWQILVRLGLIPNVNQHRAVQQSDIDRAIHAPVVRHQHAEFR